jgi:hypothetical protein
MNPGGADTKWLIIVALVVAAVVVVLQTGVFEPVAAKACRAHTETAMERRGFSDDLVSSEKWSMEIEDCSVSEDRASIRAVVETAAIPPNASSFMFATIITRTIDAETENKGGYRVKSVRP